MKSYLQIIKEQAAEANVPLLKAFSRANIPTSTYYRTINEETEVRYNTALRVSYAIDQVQAIQQAREDTKRLRADGKHVDRRAIKAKVKPRKIGK